MVQLRDVLIKCDDGTVRKAVAELIRTALEVKTIVERGCCGCGMLLTHCAA